MKVSDLLQSRRNNWLELERLCDKLKGRSKRAVPAVVAARFSSLYRSACADLALADAHQLPPATIEYLHRLVGQAHNQLYRSQTLDVRSWGRELLVAVPQRLFADNCLRLAFALFWGVFLLSAAMAYTRPDFAELAITKPMMLQMEENFAGLDFSRSGDMGTVMAGFYIFNNASIGLQCFAFGLLFGIGGLFKTVFNAGFLGAVFGYMATLPEATRNNFFEFVTAHGPFELTAIVVSAGAGMRLGFSLIDTHGYGRIAALRLAARETMPAMGAAIVMFLLAAVIEAFLSPTDAPYAIKAGVAVGSTLMLLFYFVILGYPRESPGYPRET